ncbi:MULTISPECIES: SMI1/KNR4 family protein [Streptococcus]|uniref:SMI1/KNR4 family protein n=1 Tax=Streptococcus TaxID=1301 RepID=UPI0018AC3549|nr:MULTISPECIES: SMI1/KNR4 family protein [Streptococcus]MDN5022476.1 SMI1/KNR4 family protein [Streptococcus sp. SP1]MDN5028088.1 SMI1/KNR4 family protein [Streptococcus sp. SP4]
MLVLTDTDPAISSEDFLQFEEILGKKLPKSMMDFYLKHNGGQPQVMGVHDEHHLFPFNSFDSLEEMRKSLTWYDDEAVPAGFRATDLLHFAYDPGSGNYALSLREEDYGMVYFYILEETAEVYGQWPSFEVFLNSFVEE